MIAFNMYEDLKIITMYTESLITIAIEGPEVINSLVGQFNLLWKLAKAGILILQLFEPAFFNCDLYLLHHGLEEVNIVITQQFLASWFVCFD